MLGGSQRINEGRSANLNKMWENAKRGIGIQRLASKLSFYTNQGLKNEMIFILHQVHDDFTSCFLPSLILPAGRRGRG